MDEIRLQLKIRGGYTEQDLQDYIYFSLVGGAIENDNPFISDDSEAEIMDIDFD